MRAFDVSKLPKGMAGRGTRGVRGRPVPGAGSAKVSDTGKKKEEAPAAKVKKVRRSWLVSSPACNNGGLEVACGCEGAGRSFGS